MLCRLAYASRALIDGRSVEFLDLIRTSARKNAARGVTGALFFNAVEFFQVIEGEEAVIDALFAAIQVDPRHFDVALLLRDIVEARRFCGWELKMIDGARYLHLRHLFDYDRMVAAGPSGVEKRIELLAQL
ncbi:MAG: BLUF domain-containing protein [Rubrimonas sp.]|uniref:BLUF domain-containing protein n=1 Tax=Rubrimonas sp. TaxID=2036015 RepID=UPI002FDEAC87